MSFSSGTHTGVGQQSTANGVSNDTARINQFVTIAGTGQVGLIVKGRVKGEARGFVLQNGTFTPDRVSEPGLTPAALLALAAPGSELTYTIVPFGLRLRLGFDRDLDGFRDRDELDAGSDPADPDSVPPCIGDIAPLGGNGIVESADLGALLSSWGTAGAGDIDGNGTTDSADLGALLSNWGPCQ